MPTMLQSLDELKSWDTYRTFMRMHLKLMKGEGEPIFVSKEKLEFDVNGKPWKGHAILVGKKSPMLAKKMRQEGERFLEGTFALEGKKVALEGFPEKCVKGADRTLKLLKLGYKIDRGPGSEEEAEGEEGAAGESQGATEGEEPAESGATAAQEQTWRRAKSQAADRLRVAVTGDGPNVASIRAQVQQMLQLEQSGDFAGALRALRDVLTLAEDGTEAASTAEEPSQATAPTAEEAPAPTGEADAQTGQDPDLERSAQRIQTAVQVWAKTEQLATRELRKLQRAIQASGHARARGVIQGLETIRTNLETIDDEAREAADAASRGDQAGFEAAREDFRRKVRQIEQRIARDPLIQDADANPLVQTKIRETLTTSLERLKQAV